MTDHTMAQNLSDILVGVVKSSLASAHGAQAYVELKAVIETMQAWPRQYVEVETWSGSRYLIGKHPNPEKDIVLAKGQGDPATLQWFVTTLSEPKAGQGLVTTRWISTPIHKFNLVDWVQVSR